MNATLMIAITSALFFFSALCVASCGSLNPPQNRPCDREIMNLLPKQ
ncbi:MAG: hypothetical protein ACREPR_22360 [Brasilonema sp.]